MEKKTRVRDQRPEKVIAWLRSPAGEAWSRARLGGMYHHYDDSGVFADVLHDGSSGSFAGWPEPCIRDDDLDA